MDVQPDWCSLASCPIKPLTCFDFPHANHVAVPLSDLKVLQFSINLVLIILLRLLEGA